MNPDRSSFCYDINSKILYVDLKSKNKEPVEVVKEYYSLTAITFDGDYIGIMYQPNRESMWCCCFKNGKLEWKQNYDKTDVNSYSFQFMEGEEKSLILIECNNGKVGVATFNKENINKYTIKAIRNITFQYPYIAYVWGTRELWIQDLNNKVSIYYFDGPISAMENISNVVTEQNQTVRFGMVIDMFDYVQTVVMKVKADEHKLEIDKREILKSEISFQKIKGYYRITLQNPETKRIEEAIMLHQKRYLVILSLEKKGTNYEIKKKVDKANVVFMVQKKVIIFWDNNGDKIELMKLPYDPTSTKSISKVYEAVKDIRYCKLTHIEGREYLAIIDEPNYVKILSVHETGYQKFYKVTVHKEYFIDTNFSSSSDVEVLKGYGYCNEMMYTSNGVNILQERGKEKEEKFDTLYYSKYSLQNGQSKFPMCSEDFILFSLSLEYDSTYTFQKQYLLLAPPMNSYRIKQRDTDENYNLEFFCPFDDKYVILSTYH